MRRGVATFTLDTGKCPKWLFERMVKLGREMTEILIAEFGPDEFIRRIADPVWFQSLGTVLAFDWNASGLTTILTAALKEAIKGQEKYFGVFICGGKGKTSLRTPSQIYEWGDRLSLPNAHVQKLVYNSRMAAKVDSSLVQDGFDLYHHSFFFSRKGSWAVVQQGMNAEKGRARRYHWSSDELKDLIVEPHKGIVSDTFQKSVLNMTAEEAEKNRSLSVEMLTTSFTNIYKDLILLDKYSSSLGHMAKFQSKDGDQLTLLDLPGHEFHQHPVQNENFSRSHYLQKIIGKLCEYRPQNYQSLLATEGVGPKTVRALSLISEVIYGAKASYRDPARYSFAHGGKDATPYPVDRKTYDQSIHILKKAVLKTRLSATEKNNAVRRLLNRENKN